MPTVSIPGKPDPYGPPDDPPKRKKKIRPKPANKKRKTKRDPRKKPPTPKDTKNNVYSEHGDAKKNVVEAAMRYITKKKS
jgi:hypothetical protein